jgi:ABC-type multidrug transport system permease subunit
MKSRHVFLALLLAMGVAAATLTSIASSLKSQICTVKYLVYGLLPTVALVMFLLGGLAYAAGQAFGAETKARAQNWAMALLVGGVIGVVLVILAPALVSVFVTGTAMQAWNTCA